MAKCEECLHYDVCEIMCNQYGIGKVHPSQCGYFKPTADVVEVTRCKDCKHCPDLKTKTKGMVWCRRFRTEVCPNGYCSYGERKPPEDKP